jgi:hypothetical protein
MAQRDYTVDWRFISLRIVNSAVDYNSHFPPGYEAGHTAGLKLLRAPPSVSFVLDVLPRYAKRSQGIRTIRQGFGNEVSYKVVNVSLKSRPAAVPWTMMG